MKLPGSLLRLRRGGQFLKLRYINATYCSLRYIYKSLISGYLNCPSPVISVRTTLIVILEPSSSNQWKQMQRAKLRTGPNPWSSVIGKEEQYYEQRDKDHEEETHRNS